MLLRPLIEAHHKTMHALHGKACKHVVSHSSITVHVAHLAFCVIAIHNTESLVYAASVGFMIVETLIKEEE